MIFKKYRLDEICLKITDGSHYSPKNDLNGIIPMLSVKDMERYDFNYKNCKHISEDEYIKLKKTDCVPLENDILVAKDGSYLKEIFVNSKETKKAVLSSIAIFRPNLNLVNPYYLSYLLKSPNIMNYTK
jgi:type I restriction enzyme S subunit